MKDTRVGQIAIVVADHVRSTKFYAALFGLDHIFGTNSFRGEMAEQVQGVKNAASTTRWLIDDRERFQLEVFQFEQPLPRPLRKDHGVSDQGYNRVIVAVASLDQTAALAKDLGYPVSPMAPFDASGRTTHAWLRDPDGILLELMEMPDVIYGERPAQMIGLGLTSADLELSAEDMCAGFGFTPAEDLFEHGHYWPEDGRLEKQQTLRLGDMYLVLSQYRESRPRPVDYRLSDIGIMNFAIYFPNQADFNACYQTTFAMGMRGNCEPKVVGEDASIVYNNDRQGFSVEMIYMVEKAWGLYGFARPRLIHHLLNWLAEWKARRAYTKG